VVALGILGVVLGPAVQPALAGNNPVVNDFGVAEDPNHWFIFTGTVTDPNPGSCTIHFGGLLAGHTTKCNPDGSFAFAIQLAADDNGTVTAMAVDGNGNQSTLVATTVSQ
jgi:hypothetical protein